MYSKHYVSHVHENTDDENRKEKRAKRGVNPKTQQIIERIYDENPTCSKILHKLREMVEIYLPRNNEDEYLLPNPEYVPGIVLPHDWQINNYLQTLRKNKFGGSHMTYADLDVWLEENEKIPGEGEEFLCNPFVIKSKIDIDGKVLQNSCIRISMSSRILLLNAMRRKHVCTDATYKVIYKGN